MSVFVEDAPLTERIAVGPRYAEEMTFERWLETSHWWVEIVENEWIPYDRDIPPGFAESEIAKRHFHQRHDIHLALHEFLYGNP